MGDVAEGLTVLVYERRGGGQRGDVGDVGKKICGTVMGDVAGLTVLVDMKGK
jgi:hypothetical protein